MRVGFEIVLFLDYVVVRISPTFSWVFYKNKAISNMKYMNDVAVLFRY